MVFTEDKGKRMRWVDIKKKYPNCMTVLTDIKGDITSDDFTAVVYCITDSVTVKRNKEKELKKRGIRFYSPSTYDDSDLMLWKYI